MEYIIIFIAVIGFSIYSENKELKEKQLRKKYGKYWIYHQDELKKK